MDVQGQVPWDPEPSKTSIGQKVYHFIKRRFFAWWTKYNYILAAALDTGLALSGIVIFFCISYPGATFPDWWGNNVYLNTADAQGVPYKSMPAVGYFGPANGTFS
ncbi:Oligopeptide transporter OPT superfamily [Penicillium roqueforti FM164]|uniref:Oligopeptide transporter OPT superfamily n=1 Tax=Penicillium roqueforti (strain FM164) TaxID=1365484 RepID=W6Q8Z3_PENRF|nr:Oligopeptide transporter OPT superfamily [Penicillium roqueforti FM164]